jgi:putative photosynthetic complex assembly protein
MNHSVHDHRPFPRGALLGAVALVAFALVVAATARVIGIGSPSLPVAAPVESVELRFLDRADGSVAVHEAEGDRLVDVLAPGTNGFVRSVLRGLARERKAQGVGIEPPFRLTWWADGRLTLEDASTGRRIDLEAFGSTNMGAFARLLSARSTPP